MLLQIRSESENHEGFLFRNAQALRWANPLSQAFSQISKKFLQVIAELTVNRKRLQGPVCDRKYFQELTRMTIRHKYILFKQKKRKVYERYKRKMAISASDLTVTNIN